MSHLIKDIVDQISEEMTGRDIKWKLSALPIFVYGDQSLLKLVLVNLISNAIKFTSSRARAEIEIGSSRVKEKTSFLSRTTVLGLTWTM